MDSRTLDIAGRSYRLVGVPPGEQGLTDPGPHTPELIRAGLGSLPTMERCQALADALRSDRCGIRPGTGDSVEDQARVVARGLRHFIAASLRLGNPGLAIGDALRLVDSLELLALLDAAGDVMVLTFRLIDDLDAAMSALSSLIRTLTAATGRPART